MSAPEEALLRQAAELVRERAKVATRGRTRSADVGGGESRWFPWPASEFDDDEPWEDWARGCKPTVEVSVGGGTETIATATTHDNACWIALVGPQLAEPLAAWLDSEADWKSQDPGVVDAEAIAVARALLGVSAVPAPEEEK